MELFRQLPDPAAHLEGVVEMFVHSHGLAIIFDSRGKPLWAANRFKHRFSIYLEMLMAHNIFANFKMPRVKDLGMLFEKNDWDEFHKRPLPGAGGTGRFFYPFMLQFHSKNRFEPRASMMDFVLALPVSVLRLAALSRDHFMASITMTEPYDSLQQYSHKWLLVESHEKKIVGYSRRVAIDLGLWDMYALVGRATGSVLTFETAAPLNPKPEAIVPQSEIHWQSGEPLEPLFEKRLFRGTLSAVPGGVEWRNPSPLEYSYLRLRDRFPADGTDFTIEIGFEPHDRAVPRMILRGTALDVHERPETDPPDGLGYNLTTAVHHRHLVLKRMYTPVFAALIPWTAWSGSVRLRLEKAGSRFSFYMMGMLLGEWRELEGFPPGEADLFYLYLRPGDRVTLCDVSLKKFAGAPADAGRAAAQAAILAYEKKRFHVRVHQWTETPDNRTLTYYELDDIHAFKENIQSLETVRSRLSRQLHREQALTGASPAVSGIRSRLKAVAASTLSVLIEGETGTGKEVLARAIHRESPRRRGPFVRIDCSTVPERLIESELFGHKKGAFTGAREDQAGRFEQAENGTVFLDEVANLPLSVQGKLLSVLQEFKIHPVGAERAVRLNVRLISASNVPLRTLIEKGLFRQDLFFRLNQFHFELPPLRERPEDIALLADEFLEEGNPLYQKTVHALSDGALNRLQRHNWPGNARELKNVIFHALLSARGPFLQENDLNLNRAPRHYQKRAGGPKKRIKPGAAELREAFLQCNGNVSKVAARFGVTRPTVYHWAAKWKIKVRAS